MATHLNGLGWRLGLLALALAGLVACGGGGDDGDDDAAGGSGGSGGSSGGGAGFPTRLPTDAGDCPSATGSDGCFFDACCDELVTCSENPDCATTFDCRVTCGEDPECFADCALDYLQAGRDASFAGQWWLRGRGQPARPGRATLAGLAGARLVADLRFSSGSLQLRGFVAGGRYD